MKHLRLALLLSAFALCRAHAQSGGEPDSIPDFTNLDEFTFEPKTTLTIGFRSASGVKATFSGQGLIRSPDDPGDFNDPTLLRVYHDGSVSPAVPTDNADGTTTPVPDGKTNVWTYFNDKQSTQVPGFIAEHTYSAAVTDTAIRAKDGNGSFGLDLAVSREMGKIFNSRFSWSLTAGMTINDINVARTDNVRADISTLTDLYSLDGATAPGAPYVAPSSVTEIVTDPDTGAQTSVTTDTTILLGNVPATHSGPTVTTDSTSVSNQYKLKGAYYTLRAGPTLWVPITARFRASVSMGATLVFAGSTYSVTQVFQPDTGAEIVETVASIESHLLPGYFADATVQFDLTPRTGFYAGVGVQNSGDYRQSINTSGASYATKVEFGSSQGFRAGMSIKF